MSRQIATFRMGDTRMGVDILLVKEVYRRMHVHPVPGAPPQLLGLMNLRGRVVSVVDLAACFQRSGVSSDQGQLLIFKTGAELAGFARKGRLTERMARLGEDIVGLLIDEMDDVMTVSRDAVLPPPPNLGGLDDHLIEGVIRNEGELVVLIDAPAVLDRVVRAMERPAEGAFGRRETGTGEPA
jgi:purine-binding chemotaxis protein CheW